MSAMELFKNHIKFFKLSEFDKISDNIYISENDSILLEFHENGFVKKKTSYYKNDLLEERVPLRPHSYNDLPSEVFYTSKGKVQKVNYAIKGKLHSVGGNPILSDSINISFWLNGQKNTEAVEKIFYYFKLKYNKDNAALLLPFLSIFYKSPKNVGAFIETLESIEITTPNVDNNKLELLEITYF